MTPLIETLGKNWLPDLLGTRRLNAATILEETQAPLFERQTAIFKEAAHLTRQILNYVLIIDAMNSPGEYCIEMRHQIDVVAVIASQVRQIVGEALTSRKMLLEA